MQEPWTAEPDQNTTATITPLTEKPNGRTYSVEGTINDKDFDGVLTLKLLNNEFDGYDWTGTKLGDDEMQAVLDLFAGD